MAPASKDRLMKLEHDLVALKQKQGELNKQWENEKSFMNRVRSIKEEVIAKLRLSCQLINLATS